MSGEFFLIFGQGSEVTFDLEAVPEFGRLSEECAEADGHGGSDRTAGVDDFVNRTWSNADGTSHGVLGDAHRN